MREILFRGKRIGTNEWIEGYLIDNNVIVGHVCDWDEEYFCTEFWCKVIPETVGQYTGLKDKHGTKVFEGDIIRFQTTRFHGKKKPFPKTFISPILWHEGSFFANEHSKPHVNVEKFDLFLANFFGTDANDLDDFVPLVIGNIHDHPKLLKTK